jgi:hypothetical protein
MWLLASYGDPESLLNDGEVVTAFVNEAFVKLSSPLGVCIGCAFALTIVVIGVRWFKRFVN